MKRRDFVGALGLACGWPRTALSESDTAAQPRAAYAPGRIENEYSLRLPGEEEALQREPKLLSIGPDAVELNVDGAHQRLAMGGTAGGWTLLCVANMNGTATAVFEKTVTHGGVFVYVTEGEGTILRVPKQVGRLQAVRPRQIATPSGIRFTRDTPRVPGKDIIGDYLLNSNEDPCYENVAALGEEYTGYTLVADDGSGPLRSLFLTATGASRQLPEQAEARWAPDMTGALFDPAELLPGEDPSLFEYVPGYSKRTLLGGFLPIAHTAVWNPRTKAGYETIVVWPRGENASPMGLVRATLPEAHAGERLRARGATTRRAEGVVVTERYWHSSPAAFWEAVAGVANYWQHLFEDQMQVEIPDSWLLDAARAGITLARCSYRGLAPTYQVGEGAYTKIPERSHALFPVAHYEFIWAHQVWNLTRESDPHFQHYLENYILPDGDFLYNTQDQVEGPLNAGVVLWNSARAFDYTGDAESLRRRLPVLRRMTAFLLRRYEYGKRTFAADDRRHGLIWGSPEADLGAPANDFPNSHPLYYQNSAWTWRGLKEHARCLRKAAPLLKEDGLEKEAAKLEEIAAEMRQLIERSLAATIAAGSEKMREARITPFSPDDTRHDPRQLSSYENHRFMMDWFTADWGVKELDRGHLRHRELAGHQMAGLHTDGDLPRTSNFMEHGTLAARIREDDYRPFLLTLYSLCCYAADSGNRYSPEDAWLPGGRPGEGNAYQWSAVVNSVLQPTVGLRWLLCYEESDAALCHLQKAAPKHWFASGKRIIVKGCPTRFGAVSWQTEAIADGRWKVQITAPGDFAADLAVHIHPPDGRKLRQTSAGELRGASVRVPKALLSTGGGHVEFEVTTTT